MLCNLLPIEDGRRLRCTRCRRVVRRIAGAEPSAYRLKCAGRGGRVQHGTRVAPHVEPEDLPCVHRSAAPTGEAACTLCGGRRLVPVFDCAAKRGSCTVSRVADGRPDGSTAKPWCCLGCDRHEAPAGLVKFLRPPADVRGTGLHLAGWPWAVAALRELGADDPDALLFDDFTEHTFHYATRPPHRRPWVGVFHHPPPPAPIAGGGISAGELLDLPNVRASLPHLRGAIATSEHLADYLRRRLSVPVAAIRYPGGRRDGTPWSREAWLEQPELWALGWFMRNTRVLHQLPPLGVPKRRTLPATGWPVHYDAKVAAASLRREIDDQVATLPLLDDDAYRGVLRRGVLVSELLAASANTVIVESIAYATPHAVNAHPAAVEYLGDGYPLLWRDLAELPRLLTDRGRVLAAHEYLLELPAEWLAPASFCDAVRAFLESVEAERGD